MLDWSFDGYTGYGDEWSGYVPHGHGYAPAPPLGYEYVPYATVRRGAEDVLVPLNDVRGHEYVMTERGWETARSMRRRVVPPEGVSVGGEAEFQFAPPRVRFRGYSLLGTALAIAGLIVVWHLAPVAAARFATMLV